MKKKFKKKICPKGRSLNPNTLTVFPYAKATFLRGTPKANTIRKYYNNNKYNNNNNNNNRHRNYTMHTFKPRLLPLVGFFVWKKKKRGKSRLA